MKKEIVEASQVKEPRPAWHTPEIEEVNLQKTLDFFGSLTDGVSGSIS